MHETILGRWLYLDRSCNIVKRNPRPKLAKKLAIDFIYQNKMGDTAIVSDLKSALMTIDSLQDNRKIIYENKEKIVKYPHKIQLRCVRAHRGELGNERADTLAKKATERVEIDFEFKKSKSDIKLSIKNKYLSLWQTRWNETMKGSETKKYFEKVSLKRNIGNFYLNQVYTGHGIFKTYQARFFGKSETCDCGKGTGIIDHVLLKCPEWKQLRTDYLINLDSPLTLLVKNFRFEKFCCLVLYNLLCRALETP